MENTKNSFLNDEYTANTIYSLMAGIKAHNSQMIVGDPGLGKSALVSTLAHEILHMDMITIIGSQKEPQDVTGFPRLVDKLLSNGQKISVTQYAIPVWEYTILVKKKVLLFLDEFSNSTPAVQAAMLQILNEREFPDGMKLPKDTIIIGAMNPVGTATDGYELGLPVSNRLKFLPWEPSFESWSKGMLSNWGHPENISNDELWWRGKIVAFLKKHRKLVYKLPEKDPKADPDVVYRLNGSPAAKDIFKKAFPSNRSWTNLAAELPYCRYPDKKGYSPELLQRSANGLVGYEATKSFMEFMDSSQSTVPTPEEALRNPTSISFRALDFDKIGSLFENCLIYARESNNPSVVNRLFPLTEAMIHSGNGSIYTMQHAKAVQVMRSVPDGKEKIRKLDNMVSSSNIGELMSGWNDNQRTDVQMKDVL